MKWEPIETAPPSIKDGRRLLLFAVTSRPSRGLAYICWWGKHKDWGPAWLRNDGRDIVGPGVATHYALLTSPYDS